MSQFTFTLLRQIPISSLNLQFEEYYHPSTAARHVHLAAEDSNNAFLIAFLTLPQDSTGVAHILEHTTLCGSRRYPVRDPFFLMTRRSLNTFMNAFTSSDWTAYPFSSKNIKDFNNLLQVYLDAVFFPRLDELDFAQEGHRVEFENPGEINTPLVYKGVVFNEMKGAMSSPINTLWHTLHSHLFPTSTYHYNSGGEPLEIPQLTYAQLKAFHASHYHPSNSIFMTYGNRDAREHQEWFEECALRHFQALDLKLHVRDEQRYREPQKVFASYAVGEQESLQDKTHIVLAWLLGNSTNAYEMIKAHLLTGVLLDNSASPLRHALESCPLGTSPSPLCGLDDNPREASFLCGLEGSNPEQAEAVEKMVFKVLQEVVDQGVSQEIIDSILHQIELSQREITGDHFPYGLHLLMNALPPMIHGGDPLPFLDIDPILNQLRLDCQQPHFVPQLVEQLLLKNPHWVRVVMAPDNHLSAKKLAQEQAQLASLKAAMNEEEKQSVIQRAQALQARQKREEDTDILPKVTLEDIQDDLDIPEGLSSLVAGIPTTWFARATNGMVYEKIILTLPQLEEELIDLLPWFCECLTEVGCGERDYRQTASWQASVSGGLSARISVRGQVSDNQAIQSVLSLSGKALVRNQAALAELLRETFEHARFDELPRLRELVAQLRTDADNHITSRGHHLAMTACSSGMSLSGALQHRWYGLVGIQQLRKLDEQLEDEAALKQFAMQLQKIRDQLLAAPRQFLVISEAESHAEIAQALETCWQSESATSSSCQEFCPRIEQQTIRQAWSINTQVNFCAKAYPTVPVGHPDAPVLSVLGEFLRYGYLHRVLREEGGAYGGGAHYEGDSGSFCFYSYRDPRLVESLHEFDGALEWLKSSSHEKKALEEAILSVIGRIDRPGSPAGEAIKAFFSHLHGRTPEQRRQFRSRVLKVTLEDLQRVVEAYLQPQWANIAILSNEKTLEKISNLILERKEL